MSKSPSVPEPPRCVCAVVVIASKFFRPPLTLPNNRFAASFPTNLNAAGNITGRRSLPTRVASRSAWRVLAGGGRPRVSRDALLRSFIYRALRRIRSLTALVQALHEIPALAEAMGFDPLHRLPPIEPFSAFLRTTNNSLLQAFRLELLKNLLAENVLTGHSVALDRSPIAS